MMQRGPVTLAILFEHREVDYPQWTPAIIDQSIIHTQFDTQSTDRLIDGISITCTKEQDIARLGTGFFDDSSKHIIR